MLADEGLGFWPQGQVGQDDVAVPRQQKGCEREIDPCTEITTGVSIDKNSSTQIILDVERGRCSPDPAPVTMAVLPDTLKGLDVAEVPVGATAVIIAANYFFCVGQWW